MHPNHVCNPGTLTRPHAGMKQAADASPRLTHPHACMHAAYKQATRT